MIGFSPHDIIVPDVPYVGPGTEQALGSALGTVSLKDALTALYNTPATGDATPDTGNDVPAGLFARGYGNPTEAGNMLLYHPAMAVRTMGLWDFNDPNCFPLARSATSVPQALPASTKLNDLSTFQWGSASEGTAQAVLYPNSADEATATALTYKIDNLGFTGINFTDTGSTPAEAINIAPTGYNSLYPPFAKNTAKEFLWAIVIGTPGGLSSFQNAALFTVGDQLDATLQVAFCVKDGKFGAYVNGPNFVGRADTINGGTRYLLAVHYRPDPYSPRHFQARFYLNGNWSDYSRFPFPVSSQPWVANNSNRALAVGGATPVAGFGPKVAFGDAWAYTAFAYLGEDMSDDPLRQPDDVLNVLQSYFSIPHAA